jgi:hypothetical protein
MGWRRRVGLEDYLRCVTHLLQFLDGRLNSTGTNQEDAIRQSAYEFLGQLLSGQKLLGEHGIFGMN